MDQIDIQKWRLEKIADFYRHTGSRHQPVFYFLQNGYGAGRFSIQKQFLPASTAGISGTHTTTLPKIFHRYFRPGAIRAGKFCRYTDELPQR